MKEKWVIILLTCLFTDAEGTGKQARITYFTPNNSHWSTWEWIFRHKSIQSPRLRLLFQQDITSWKKEVSVGHYILRIPPSLILNKGSHLMPAKFWCLLLRQAAEMRNCSRDKDEITWWRWAPLQSYSSKVQGRTKQTYWSQQQHGQLPGSAALLSARHTAQAHPA